LREITPSGSFAKGTAKRSGTDIDLFLYLAAETSETLSQIYNSLDTALKQEGYKTRRQNVSLNIRVNTTQGGVYDVDLVPAK
jgi:tRNA nucleotidyltransferase (CCA-adding enzyme)